MVPKSRRLNRVRTMITRNSWIGPEPIYNPPPPPPPHPFCGGTLLSSDTVLSAAHCKKDVTKFWVAVGRHDTRE